MTKERQQKRETAGFIKAPNSITAKIKDVETQSKWSASGVRFLPRRQALPRGTVPSRARAIAAVKAKKGDKKLRHKLDELREMKEALDLRAKKQARCPFSSANSRHAHKRKSDTDRTSTPYPLEAQGAW